MSSNPASAYISASVKVETTMHLKCHSDKNNKKLSRLQQCFKTAKNVSSHRPKNNDFMKLVDVVKLVNFLESGEFYEFCEIGEFCEVDEISEFCQIGEF